MDMVLLYLYCRRRAVEEYNKIGSQGLHASTGGYR